MVTISEGARRVAGALSPLLIGVLLHALTLVISFYGIIQLSISRFSETGGMAVLLL